MQYRVLGRTGERVSALGVGGWHLGLPKVDESTAVAIVRGALDAGINFLDNSWDYNEGVSEERMGKALADGYRERAFLMTKIDGRTKQDAARQLEDSLRRLRTDCIDLVQHHEVIRFEDPDRIFAPGGAQEALLEAREAGKLRYIGFTGHKDPHVHLYMLEVAQRNGFVFDTVQMPLNVMDAHFRSFERLALPELVRRGMGVLGMKSMGNGLILRSGLVSAGECLRYALTLPTSVVITGMDRPQILQQAIEVASTFEPMTTTEIEAILARTARAAQTGRWELFKTTSAFDSTTEHVEWLGKEPDWVVEATQP
ncbi:MAG TPA: aldo/keto reductase [Longimicrobiales bacterium]